MTRYNPEIAADNAETVETPLPADMNWQEFPTEDGRFEALHTPGRARGWVLLPCAIFWNGCLIAIVHEMWTSARLAAMVTPLLGIVLAYATLVDLLNRTRVSLSPHGLYCHSSPIPDAVGKVEQPTRELQDFVVSAGIYASEPGHGAFGMYAVYAEFSGGRMVRLPFRGIDARHATFIASRLNRILSSLRSTGTAYRS